MKIYIASSWKNRDNVIMLKDHLIKYGHKVDAFCDFRDEERIVFDFKQIPNWETYNAKSFLNIDEVEMAFNQDKKMIDWADCVILLLPAGKSSHLEAGYAKGTNKKLIIAGDFPSGEIDVMYGFADELFHINNELPQMLNWLDLKK